MSNRVMNPSYLVVHQRLRRSDRGKASEFMCTDCAKPAKHWSFSWRRVPTDRIQYDPDRGYPFSTEPSDYDPRCVADARRYDHISVREMMEVRSAAEAAERQGA